MNPQKTSKPGKERANQGPAERDAQIEMERYSFKALSTAIDFDLERQAIQDILDSVLRLQTYIALREAR